MLPKLTQRRAVPRIPLFIVAILMGLTGVYALISSFAETASCTLDLDYLHVGTSNCPVVKSDTAASASLATIDSLWGGAPQCADPARVQAIAMDGDPHLTANGSAQENSSYYKISVLDGDDYAGERCELGRNERRYGQNGGSGTFQLYHEGDHKITFASIRLPSNFPADQGMWQTILQMKQTQPTYTAGVSPILEMQEFNNQFYISSDPGGILWSTSAVSNKWLRFAFDVTYSKDASKGKLKIYVDKNGDGDTLDAGEQSPFITAQTLAVETQSSEPPGPILQPGESVPGHLRLGLYHNPAYNCPAPGGCSINDDNVQVVDLTNVTTTVVSQPVTSPPTGPKTLRADITGPNGAPDGKVDLQDVSYAIRAYNTADTRADISGPSGAPDGKVDIYDISYIIRNYGG